MTMDAKTRPVGALRGASLRVTEEAIRAYAELTNDFNPIHLDAEFAAKTPMGRPIAHGTMSLCLIWQCLGRNFTADQLAAMELDVRFVKPVYVGDQLSAGGEPDPQAPGQWKVWVRAQDGADRILGTARSATQRSLDFPDPCERP